MLRLENGRTAPAQSEECCYPEIANMGPAQNTRSLENWRNPGRYQRGRESFGKNRPGLGPCIAGVLVAMESVVFLGDNTGGETRSSSRALGSGMEPCHLDRDV